MSFGSMHSERAVHLLQAGRAEDALEELGKAIADDPEDAHAHALRGLALADLGDRDGAVASADRAIAAAPDWSYPWFAKAHILLSHAPKEAQGAAEEALRLDPEEPDHHGILAASLVARKKWRAAAEAAAQGLELDPDHDQCLNLRAMALRQLGETDGAANALEVSLANEPENAWTLQNLGYLKLQEGEPEEAARLFREALRLDPEDGDSRAGLGLAIKARVPLFRPILAWQMLCERLSGALGLGLILGLWLVNRLVQSSSLKGTALGTSVLVAYIAFVWMTWAGSALFDVALLTNRSLRPILERREKVAAAGVGTVVVLALASLGMLFWWGGAAFGLPTMALAFAAIPVAGWAPLPNGRARALGAAIGGLAFALAVGSFAAAVLNGPPAPGTGTESVVDPVDMDGVTGGAIGSVAGPTSLEIASTLMAAGSVILSVGASWLLTALGFVPERRGARGKGRRPGA